MHKISTRVSKYPRIGKRPYLNSSDIMRRWYKSSVLDSNAGKPRPNPALSGTRTACTRFGKGASRSCAKRISTLGIGPLSRRSGGRAVTIFCKNAGNAITLSISDAAALGARDADTS